MKVALATCERPPVPDLDLAPLSAALVERGVGCEVVAWTDSSADWAAFDLVVICSTWDYHERLDQFRGWLAAVEDATVLRNPRAVVEWNLDKRYLAELDHEGVPVIPTVWCEPGGGSGAVTAVTSRGWDRVVVKPVVDLGAANLVLTRAGEVEKVVDAVGTACMVQPFLESLASAGELSIVSFAGRVSHAIRKRPAAGDFRVQEQYGGVYSRAHADPDEAAVAEAAVAAVARACPAAADALYSRVDLVSGPDGTCVIEVELIEPSFFLDIAGPAAADRAAEVIAGACAAG